MEIRAKQKAVNMALVTSTNQEISEHSDRYFKKGENYRIDEWYSSGFISNAYKNIFFTIPLAKNTKYVSNVSIKSGTLKIRSVEGKYLENNLVLPDAKVSVSYLRDKYLTIAIKSDIAYTTTNNTPVAIQLDGLLLNFN